MSGGTLTSIKPVQNFNVNLNNFPKNAPQKKSELSVYEDGPDRTGFEFFAPCKRKAVLVAVKLKELASHQLWMNTSALSGEVIPKGGIFFIDLDGEQCAYLASSTEVDLSPTDSVSGNAQTLNSQVASAELDCFHCEVDPVIEGLIKLALLALERPEKLTPLFAQHLAAVLHAHILGRDEFSPGRMIVPGTLARWQERRAKQMMSKQLEGEICLESVAKACNLSIAHFSRAFAATVGTPPHRWLVQRRIFLACDLLRGCHSLTLADVACRCGFADQSHFTRVFKKVIGISPGVWRRKITAPCVDFEMRPL
ncbi:helix-turn-helix domain-containing protein [Pseudomonas abietaniphila]|uniref:AraC-type DNA-binding protein n=1 Tax=Pseudomonas abietaniphila TaxID=89065 RepID=A0A1G8PUZ7_9PSED|nr:AraC family transcriptional regulator [Pseudomonas abietaniphila]SDI96045.1 AraC-type DNA-binding protein [Pseudomonas abietaniphila]